MVYFVQEPVKGFIKIGTTTCGMKDRLSSLQSGSPWRLSTLKEIPMDRRAEKVIHRIFQKDRLSSSREWFRPSEDLMKFIALEEEKILGVVTRCYRALQINPKQTFILNFGD